MESSATQMSVALVALSWVAFLVALASGEYQVQPAWGRHTSALHEKASQIQSIAGTLPMQADPGGNGGGAVGGEPSRQRQASWARPIF
eukprot:3141459-Prymnesium_polylepis.1